MGNAKSRPRSRRRNPRYAALHSGLNILDSGMAVGCVILFDAIDDPKRSKAACRKARYWDVSTVGECLGAR